MPILPFWNSQSLVYNILLFEKYAMNSMTEIEENICLLFLLSVSITIFENLGNNSIFQILSLLYNYKDFIARKSSSRARYLVPIRA